MAALYFRIQFKPTAGLSWECGMGTTELCHFSIINRYLVVFYLHSRGHSFKTAGKSEQVVICFQNKMFVMDKSAYERIQGKSTLFVWAKSFKMHFFFCDEGRETTIDNSFSKPIKCSRNGIMHVNECYITNRIEIKQYWFIVPVRH